MQPVSKTEQQIIDDIRSTMLLLKKRIEKRQTFSELSPSQLNVLIDLEKEKISNVTALSQRQGITAQSIGATLNILKEKGLIDATADPKDKRRTLLTLTPKCQEEIKTFRSISERWLSQAIQQQLNTQEKQALQYGLSLLKRISETSEI